MGLNLNDYFDDDLQEQNLDGEQQAQPIKPQPINEEQAFRRDYIEGRSQRRRRRWRMWLGIAALVIIVTIITNMLFLSKTTEKGIIKGYIVKMELADGIIFDSYECTMVADLPDSTSIDNPDLIMHFSVNDKNIGERIHRAMLGDSIVAVYYKRYTSTMPWRGNTDVIADSIKMLPGESLRSLAQVAADKKKNNDKKQ